MLRRIAALLFGGNKPEFRDYPALAAHLKTTAPNSRERMKALIAGNEAGLLDTSRFGANVTIVSPIPEKATENEVLDNVRVAQIQRRFKGADGQSKPDGIGAFGGRGDPGETPIIAALREMLEEYADAGHIQIPEGVKASDHIKDRIDAFLDENKGACIRETGNDPQKIRKAIGILRESNAAFKVTESFSIDFWKFEYVPFDEAVDLSFPMGVSEGKNIGHKPDGTPVTFSFDNMQVTKPFQFTYKTETEEEFQLCLSKPGGAQSVVNPDREAADVIAVSLRQMITSNRSGQALYNPETDPRYVHEGMVASHIAAQAGVREELILALQPNARHQAQVMGVSENTFKQWVRSPRQPEPAAWIYSSSVVMPG